MMKGSFIFMLMFALGGGGGGDLLDFTDTTSYWISREQRVLDVQTMSAVLADEKASTPDKLMAIRALGELGKAADADAALKTNALAVLGPLVDSKEPFVGQYARRSIAWIKGQDPMPTPMVSDKDLASDLAILPHTCSIVGQLRVQNGVGPVDWDKLLPGFVGDLAEQKKQMIGEANQGILQMVGMIGNVRLDAVTVGFNFFENTTDDGYAVVVGRGQYDRVAVQLAFQDMAEKERDDEGWSFYSIGDIEVIAKEDGWNPIVILMPSDQQFIFISGENRQGLKMYPIDEIADLIKKGDGQPTFSDAVTAQISKIDRAKADAWVAMQVPAFMKNDGDISEVLGPFNAGHLFAVRDSEGSFDVTMSAEGDDAAAVGEVVTMLNEQIKSGQSEIRAEAARNPEMQAIFGPMLKMMDSMKIQANGKSMNGTMKLPGGLGAIMPMFAMPMRNEAQFQQIQPQNAAEEAVEVE